MKNSSTTTPKKFMKWTKEATIEYTNSKAKEEDTEKATFKKQNKAIAPAKCLRNKSAVLTEGNV